MSPARMATFCSGGDELIKMLLSLQLQFLHGSAVGVVYKTLVISNDGDLSPTKIYFFQN